MSGPLDDAVQPAGGDESSSAGEDMRSRIVLTGFSWPAFLFPWLWPFLHGLPRLGAIGLAVMLVPAAIRLAVSWPLLAAGTPLPDYASWLWILLAAAEFVGCVWIGFRATRAFRAAHPDSLKAGAFARRQVGWRLAVGGYLLVMSILFVFGPVWITSRISLGSSAFGISLYAPDQFSVKPLAPDSTFDLVTLGAPPLPDGVYRAVLAASLSGSNRMPPSWFVIVIGPDGTKTAYRASRTIFSTYRLNGSRTSRTEIEERAWAAGRQGVASTVTIVMRAQGEIASVDASLPSVSEGF